MNEIKVPELGDDISDATIACWHVKEGDVIQEEDDVVELVTDKASFNISAPTAGQVQAILYADGETVTVGQVIARLA